MTCQELWAILSHLSCLVRTVAGPLRIQLHSSVTAVQLPWGQAHSAGGFQTKVWRNPLSARPLVLWVLFAHRLVQSAKSCISTWKDWDVNKFSFCFGATSIWKCPESALWLWDLSWMLFHSFSSYLNASRHLFHNHLLFELCCVTVSVCSAIISVENNGCVNIFFLLAVTSNKDGTSLSWSI